MPSQTFTASDPAWPWPAGVTVLDLVECYGGGGAGGAYCNRANVTKTEATIIIDVGGGGAAGSASDGGVGGASIVTQATNTHCSAPGGLPGRGGTTNSTNFAGGLGQTTGAIGDVVRAGGNGADGIFTSGTPGGAGGGGAGSTGVGGNASAGTGGTGGGGLAAAGADGVADSTAGTVGSPAGGGASGGKANSAPNKVGAVGGAGRVVITWSDPTTTKDGTDAVDVSVSETTSINVALEGTEAVDVGVSEDAIINAILAGTDTLDVGVDEAPSIRAILGGADALDISITEDGVVSVSLGGDDSLDVDVSEAVEIWELIAVTAADALTYTDEGLSSGEYCYKVRAVRSGEYSVYSNVDCATVVSLTTKDGTDSLDVSISENATVSVTIAATDTLDVVVVDGDSQPEINLQVAASADDCGIDDTAFSNTATFHVVGRLVFGAIEVTMATRWASASLLDLVGATIVSAVVRLRAASTKSSTTVASLCFELDGNPPQISDGSDYLSRFAGITEGVEWTYPATTDGEWYESPNLASSLQEVVDLPGFTGQALNLLHKCPITGGDREWRTYDNAPGDAAQLDVVYLLQGVFVHVTLSSSDDLNVALDETYTILAFVPATDDLNLTITETTAIAATLAATETLDVSITDAGNLAGIPIAGVDNLDIAITEVAATITAVPATETIDVAIDETTVINNDLVVADTLAVSLDEGTSIGVVLAASETLDVSITDAGNLAGIPIAGTDTLDVTIAESGVIASPVAVTETLNLEVSESTAIAGSLAASETLDVALEELPAIFAAVLTNELLDVAIDELITPKRLLVVTESIDVEVIESGLVIIVALVSDTLDITISESYDLDITIAPTSYIEVDAVLSVSGASILSVSPQGVFDISGLHILSVD